MAEKRIGFVDYRLDNFHSNVYLKHARGELKGRGHVVAGCFALDEEEGRTWAEANEVPYFDSVAALDPEVDFYFVLAPSNPEVHLELCEMVFPFGKPTYVDKTFAPDLATAERIFELADEHGVPMQTTSALRYTQVQDYVEEVGREAVRHMVSWGDGGSFGEYAIHPVELVVSRMGAEAESLMRRGTGDESQLLINFSGGRTAVVNVYTKARTPFAASVTTSEATRLIEVDTAAIFVRLAAAVLDLFDSGKPDIDRAESLMIRRILDAADEPEALGNFVPL